MSAVSSRILMICIRNFMSSASRTIHFSLQSSWLMASSPSAIPLCKTQTAHISKAQSMYVMIHRPFYVFLWEILLAPHGGRGAGSETRCCRVVDEYSIHYTLINTHLREPKYFGPKKEKNRLFAVEQMFCHRPAPEIFQGRTQLDQCGQWAYRSTEPNRKTPPRHPPQDGLASCFPAALSQENRRRIQKERRREEMRDVTEEGRRKIESWVSLPSNNLSLPAWPPHKETANMCGGRP